MSSKVEVAKLFAKLGFEIDTTQLERFEQLTRGLRASTVKLARDLRATNTQLTAVSTKLRSVNNGLNSVSSRKGAGNLAQSYASLSRNVNVAQTSLNRISTTLTTVEPKLVQQALTVSRLARSWSHYAREVRRANDDLRNRPSGSPPRPPRGGAGGNGGGSGGSGGRGGGSGGSGFLGGAAAGFLSNFTPAAGLAGGAITAGYAAKNIIQTGRDFQAMKQILLASSQNTEDFNKNLEFTKATANSLGTNVIEFGKAYAKTIQSVGDKLPRKQTEEMFKGFSELMVVMHSSDDDQKGVFRAMSQMFSKGKIQMEEINQMAERNVPALAMMTRAYKELGLTASEFEKLQQKGQIDPSKFLPLMAKYAAEFARNNGALEKAMNSSVTQQNLFMNKMREMANQIMEAGLDKALGDMFKALTKLATAFTPLALWIAKATVALIAFIGYVKDFAKEHPIIFAMIVGLAGGFWGLRLAMRAGMLMWTAFFVNLIRGLFMVKAAVIRTAILAIFVAIAEVLMALYEHMNGQNNWISVMIGWFEILGLKIKSVWLDFQMLISSFENSLKNSWVGKFFEKIFSFDFRKAVGLASEDGTENNSISGISPLMSTQQRAGAFFPNAEGQQRLQQTLGFGNTIPSAGGTRNAGSLDVNYKMEVVNGKQVFTSSNTQKVNIGGLRP